jgi:serine/threonine-protein kinase
MRTSAVDVAVVRTCPRCRLSYPTTVEVCPRDGARLSLGETESVVDDEPDEGFSPRTGTEPLNLDVGDSTKADRPSARRSNPGQRHTPQPRARRPTRPEERIGDVLGQYRIVDLLGRGGMGCVYLAEHLKLGRRVALKLLRPEHAERRDAVARFFQEARAVNKIRHRNIVDVTDLVEADDGTTFIIMELLDGMSLSKLMRAQQLDVPRALAILAQICDGLAAAHSVGIVHRDLKPDNVFVVATGDGADLVKLLDFGVAKLLHREDEQVAFETAAGAVVGTPTFMSPEQAGGGEVDARADIYSLGAIMYEMFTGEPIFRGKSFGEFVRKHLNETPVPPRQTPGGRAMDERLEAVILRCLRKRPAERFADILELKDELLLLLGAIETQLPSQSAIVDGPMRRSSLAPTTPAPTVPPTRPGLRGTPLPAPRGGMPPSPYPVDTAMAMGDLPGTSPNLRTGQRALAVIGLAALAGLAVALYLLLGRQDGDDPLGEEQRPRAAASVGPEVTPVDPPPDRPAPGARVVVRFQSTPSAGVFADAAPTATCTTPCDVTIDPTDGGARVRPYLIARDGYRTEPVRIDLDHPQRTVSVHLVSLRDADRGGKPASGKRPGDRPGGGTATTATDAPPPPEVQPKQDPTSGKKPGRIDPAQTRDPFGPR